MWPGGVVLVLMHVCVVQVAEWSLLEAGTLVPHSDRQLLSKCVEYYTGGTKINPPQVYTTLDTSLIGTPNWCLE